MLCVTIFCQGTTVSPVRTGGRTVSPVRTGGRTVSPMKGYIRFVLSFLSTQVQPNHFLDPFLIIACAIFGKTHGKTGS